MKAIRFMGVLGLMFAVASCGGNKQAASDSAAAGEEAVVAEQPVESGVYDAVYFNITGKEPRKGAFDGRVIYSVSPDQTAILVYENGNRTKIKHIIMLSESFTPNDSIYNATDAKGNPVVLSSDTASYYINYIASGDTVTITHNRKARNTYTALEALEKIQEEATKK